MSTLLNVHNLSWHAAGKPILQNISFNVSKGEVLGIIGPNGSGKTSLLKCITQQLKSHLRSGVSGSIHLKNKKITQYKAKELAQHFAMVMQNNEASFALSVLEIMKMGLLPYKKLFSFDTDHDFHQIELALNKVGLRHKLHSAYHELSGGEQQRVLIARALVQSSDILILDEPTNHLDVYYQHQILQLVSQLPITVIMTVHDLNLASQYCQRLLLLNQGKLVADNTPENMLSQSVIPEVFGLPCQQDIDPVTQATRVSFYLPKVNESNTLRNHSND